MGTYEELKAAIQQVIRTNGNNEITGAILKNVLLSIINVVGANATFAGIATPNTNPGTAEQNVFYLATEAGTYVNFGDIVIKTGEAVILSNKTGKWTKTTSGFATKQQLTELDQKLTDLKKVTFYNEDAYYLTRLGERSKLYDSEFFNSVRVAVFKGDIWSVKGYGYGNGRLWATLDSEHKVVRMAEISTSVESYDITIEEGECFLVHNTTLANIDLCLISSDNNHYNGVLSRIAFDCGEVQSDIKDIHKEVNSLKDLIEDSQIIVLQEGYRNTKNIGDFPSGVVASSSYRTCRFAVQEGDIVEFYGGGTNTARLWATIDTAGKIVRNSAADLTESSKLVIEAEECAFIFNTYATLSTAYVRVNRYPSVAVDRIAQQVLLLNESVDTMQFQEGGRYEKEVSVSQGTTFRCTFEIPANAGDMVSCSMVADIDLWKANGSVLVRVVDTDNITSDIGYVSVSSPTLTFRAASDIQSIIFIRDVSFIVQSGKARLSVLVRNAVDGNSIYAEPLFLDTTRFYSGYLLSDGSLYENDYYRASHFIDVRGARSIEIKTFYCSNYGQVFFYDKFFNLLRVYKGTAGVVDSYSFYLDEAVYYIRYVCTSGQLQTTAIRATLAREKDADVISLVRSYIDASFQDNGNLFENAARTPIITIIDDDTISQLQVERFYNACETNGIKGTYAVLTQRFENNVELQEMLLQYEREGHNMCLHSYTQHEAFLDDNQAETAMQDLIRGMQDMQKAGFIDYKHWVTPFGVATATMQQLAKKVGMDCLVSIGQNYYETTKYKYGRYLLPRPNLNPDSDIDSLKGLVNGCVADKGWLLLGIHVYDWTDDQLSTIFADFISYCKGMGITFMTLGEAIRQRMPIYRFYETYR